MYLGEILCSTFKVQCTSFTIYTVLNGSTVIVCILKMTGTVFYILTILTLRALSLFFKILPNSNTGDSIAYNLATVHFLYPKIGSFSDMEYHFHQLAYLDSKVPSYTHDFRFHSKENASGTHQRVWAGPKKCKICQQRGGCAPFQPLH